MKAFLDSATQFIFRMFVFFLFVDTISRDHEQIKTDLLWLIFLCVYRLLLNSESKPNS